MCVSVRVRARLKTNPLSKNLHVGFSFLSGERTRHWLTTGFAFTGTYCTCMCVGRQKHAQNATSHVNQHAPATIWVTCRLRVSTFGRATSLVLTTRQNRLGEAKNICNKKKCIVKNRLHSCTSVAERHEKYAYRFTHCIVTSQSYTYRSKSRRRGEQVRSTGSYRRRPSSRVSSPSSSGNGQKK